MVRGSEGPIVRGSEDSDSQTETENVYGARLGHKWHKPRSAFGRARWFSSGFSRFHPPTDLHRLDE